MPLPSHFLSEKHFLISLALNQYNAQYNRKFKITDCDIRSIPARPYTDRGYEINTLTMRDEVRMHMFVTFGSATIISPYILETEAPYATPGLTDETFVAYLSVDRYYIDQDIYKFRPLLQDYSLLPLIWAEDGKFIVDENNNYFLQEATDG